MNDINLEQHDNKHATKYCIVGLKGLTKNYQGAGSANSGAYYSGADSACGLGLRPRSLGLRPRYLCVHAIMGVA